MFSSAIGVTSIFALVAFLAAVIGSVLSRQMKNREKLIRSAPKEERATLVQDALEFFHVDTYLLSPEHQYDIAIQQIHARARRYKSAAITVCVLSIVAAIATVMIAGPATMKQADKKGSSESRPKAELVSLNKTDRNIDSRWAIRGNFFDPYDVETIDIRIWRDVDEEEGIVGLANFEVSHNGRVLYESDGYVFADLLGICRNPNNSRLELILAGDIGSKYIRGSETLVGFNQVGRKVEEQRVRSAVWDSDDWNDVNRTPELATCNNDETPMIGFQGPFKPCTCNIVEMQDIENINELSDSLGVSEFFENVDEIFSCDFWHQKQQLLSKNPRVSSGYVNEVLQHKKLQFSLYSQGDFSGFEPQATKAGLGAVHLAAPTQQSEQSLGEYALLFNNNEEDGWATLLGRKSDAEWLTLWAIYFGSKMGATFPSQISVDDEGKLTGYFCLEECFWPPKFGLMRFDISAGTFELLDSEDLASAVTECGPS